MPKCLWLESERAVYTLESFLLPTATSILRRKLHQEL